jgi:hypothetical protein
MSIEGFTSPLDFVMVLDNVEKQQAKPTKGMKRRKRSITEHELYS